MPAKTRQKNSAPRSRTRTHVGKEQSSKRRQGHNGGAADNSRIIANSIFALTLPPKPAIEVNETLSGKGGHRNHWEDDYQKMYKDLLALYQRAVWINQKQKTKFDPLASGLSFGSAMFYVVNGFKSFLPKGWELNIDRDDDDGNYFITAYFACDFPGYWHTFEIEPVVNYLKKRNPKLLTLFFEFINHFVYSKHISAWWNGGFDYAEWAFEEWIHENGGTMEDEDDERVYHERKALLESYQSGEISKYEHAIRRVKLKTAGQLKQRLSVFRKRNPVVLFLHQMLEFFNQPGTMSDFFYRTHDDEEGLRFDQQVTVIWAGDSYAECQAEGIDAEAQGCGVLEPYLHRSFHRGIKIDLEKLEPLKEWPKKLSELHDQYCELLKKLK